MVPAVDANDDEPRARESFGEGGVVEGRRRAAGSEYDHRRHGDAARECRAVLGVGPHAGMQRRPVVVRGGEMFGIGCARGGISPSRGVPDAAQDPAQLRRCHQRIDARAVGPLEGHDADGMHPRRSRKYDLASRLNEGQRRKGCETTGVGAPGGSHSPKTLSRTKRLWG